MAFRKCECIFPIVTVIGGTRLAFSRWGPELRRGEGTRLSNELPCSKTSSTRGEISSGIETLRRAMILPLPQSSSAAKLGFIHKSEQEMCQESTLFFSPCQLQIRYKENQRIRNLSHLQNIQQFLKRIPGFLVFFTTIFFTPILREERSALRIGKPGGI